MGMAIWAAQLERKKWILLIDGDMHVRTVELKMCPVTDATLADVLEGDKELEDAVYLCELESEGEPLFPRLAVLPAGGRFLPAMRGNPIEFIDKTKRKFDRLMKKLRSRFQYIFVDTPASMSFEHLILTAIADLLIYVCEPNDDSIESTKMTAEGIKEFMDIEPLGVVLNRFTPQLKREKWVGKAGEIAKVLGVIPDDPLVPESFSENLPIVAAHPDSPASRAIREITNKVLKAKVEKARVSERFDRAIHQTAEHIK